MNTIDELIDSKNELELMLDSQQLTLKAINKNLTFYKSAYDETIKIIENYQNELIKINEQIKTIENET